jgi:hypothetical protein
MSAQKIEMPAKPLLPMHAEIALSNAAIAVKEAERNVAGLWTSPNSHYAVEFIRKARRLLDEAEAAIHGVAAQ